MRRQLTAILQAAILSGICAGQTPNIDQVFDSLLDTHHFAEVAISPDGQRVVWIEKTVKTDSQYAHTVYVEDLNSKNSPRLVRSG